MGYLKNVLADYRYIYYYSQKALRWTFLRKFLWKFISFIKPSFSKSQEQPSGSVVEEMAAAGFSYLPSLSKKEISEIEYYLETKKVYSHQRAEPFYFPGGLVEGDNNAHYFANDLIECRHLLKLANHPIVLSSLQKMFGCKPTITVIEAWWNIAGKSQPLIQNYLYHRDVEDFKFAKLFLYLTDVDIESGPHVFIRGSQNSNHLVRRGSISESEISKYFKKEDCYIHTGKKGTIFLEDTWGIHRGIPPTHNHRLIFSVTYTLTKQNPNLPKKPYKDLKLSSDILLDKYVNRAYLKLN